MMADEGQTVEQTETNGHEPVELTENFLLTKSGQKSLGSIRTIDLSGLELTDIPTELFKKLTHLETLNLSNNQLKGLPASIGLNKLQKLDLSENRLDSLEFVEQFPQLKELYVDGSGLDPSDKYIAALLCPSIKQIDKTSTTSITAMVETWKRKIEPEVKSIWKDDFAHLVKEKQKMPEETREDCVKKISEKVKERKLMGSTALLKFRDFLINKMCAEMLDKVKNETDQPQKKKHKMSDTPAATKKFGKKIRRDLGACLPEVADYDPIHFVRCHFGDRTAGKSGHLGNDPTDDITKVWGCEFEPHTEQKGRTTGVVATCGGDTVCLIDCSTGKVLKRYQQAKEQFYCLAWTTLQIGERKSNILTVGGNNGHIKLLHPEQLVCYKQLGTGKPNRQTHQYYVSCLLFHPERESILFSGASDTTVTVWDIGIPSGPNYDSDCKSLAVLHATEGSGILNMVFDAKSCCLIAGCEASCFAWHLRPDMKPKSKEPSIELVLPGGKEAEVDGMIVVAEDLVASKCSGESTIYVWQMSKSIGKNTSTITVEPLLSLEWCETEVEYITLGSREGVLVSGDDKGNIWLYNLNEWLRSRKAQPRPIQRPSRILPWPYCQLAKSSQSQKMKDVLDPPELVLLKYKEEIVVNCSTISSECEYVVTGTDNNLVCIWKRCDQD